MVGNMGCLYISTKKKTCHMPRPIFLVIMLFVQLKFDNQCNNL